MNATATPAPAGEMLYGVKAIAGFLGIPERKALWLIEKDALPHWREGRTICARPSTLRTWLAQREATSGRGPAIPVVRK